SREGGIEPERQKTSEVAVAASTVLGQSRKVSERIDETGSLAAQTPDCNLLEMEDRISPLVTGGMVIGLFQNCPYEQETIQLETGDLIIAYTDGVTEAMNRNAEEFSEARLRRVVAGSAHLAAEELSRVIISTVREWRANLEQHDDLTLVIMKVR